MSDFEFPASGDEVMLIELVKKDGKKFPPPVWLMCVACSSDAGRLHLRNLPNDVIGIVANPVESLEPVVVDGVGGCLLVCRHCGHRAPAHDLLWLKAQILGSLSRWIRKGRHRRIVMNWW